LYVDWLRVYWLFIFAAWFVLDINSFIVVIFDDGFRPLVGVELLLELLFVHNSPAGPIAVGYIVFALVSVMAVLQTSLASDYS
jgi:hypothetical protein